MQENSTACRCFSSNSEKPKNQNHNTKSDTQNLWNKKDGIFNQPRNQIFDL